MGADGGPFFDHWLQILGYRLGAGLVVLVLG